MAKEKRPKDDLQTVAKSRMAHLPAESAGGRLDENATPGREGQNADPRRDLPPRRDAPPGHGTAQPSGAEAREERPMAGRPAATATRADKQRNQPRR